MNGVLRAWSYNYTNFTYHASDSSVTTFSTSTTSSPLHSGWGLISTHHHIISNFLFSNSGNKKQRSLPLSLSLITGPNACVYIEFREFGLVISEYWVSVSLTPSMIGCATSHQPITGNKRILYIYLTWWNCIAQLKNTKIIKSKNRLCCCDPWLYFVF